MDIETTERIITKLVEDLSPEIRQFIKEIHLSAGNSTVKVKYETIISYEE